MTQFLSFILKLLFLKNVNNKGYTLNSTTHVLKGIIFENPIHTRLYKRKMSLKNTMLFIRLINCIYLRMPFKSLEKRASKHWRHWAEQCINLIKVCQTFWHCPFKSRMMCSRAWAPLYAMSTPSYSVTRRPHKVLSVTVSNQIVSLMLTTIQFSLLSVCHNKKRGSCRMLTKGILLISIDTEFRSDLETLCRFITIVTESVQ
jgi:hypothetical protein